MTGAVRATTGRLPAVLALLMAAQAATGLAVPGLYRDAGWIRAGWVGNDAVTLLVAVPLLVVTVVGVRRGSGRAALAQAGLLGYAGYNYAFYLFGATLNAMFPVYAALVVLSVTALIGAPAGDTGSGDEPSGIRVAGLLLTGIGAGLALVWLALWAGHVVADRPVPAGPDAFRLVAALDLTVMVPLLVSGGVLLWRRHPWGRRVAVLAGVQASLYLLVLAVNSAAAVLSGSVAAPGELPVWAGLLVPAAGATAVLLWGPAAGRGPTAVGHPVADPRVAAP
ncbi:hypothetical protein [Pseudonocardia abyssalis]|uniref:Uncharacterized protein n=2 Tax=Pseudonocardia abyssalis TaxID=2792008 RepID=A0ABS6UNH3_9PSEU|nr:hypothetical protein [Pseudonocardia abyssalis]MBW0133803.1 hypothetical protein [Pseudonocardia abyssalis]